MTALEAELLTEAANYEETLRSVGFGQFLASNNSSTMLGCHSVVVVIL